MNVAFVGSRSWDDERSIRNRIADLDPGDIVVTGGARGADRIAERLARERGLAVEVIRADWQTYGRAAGMLRNRTLVERCDRVIAFWDGKSPGTRHTIELARMAGKRVEVIR